MQTMRPANLYDTILMRYPVAFESRMVGTTLGSTHVLLSGDEVAPPIVLIHGAGMNALAWLGQVAEFSARFRVAAVDLPGQSGRSDLPHCGLHALLVVEVERRRQSPYPL